MANCSKCGAQLPPNAVTCEYCGTTVEVPHSPSGGAYSSSFAPGASGAYPAFKIASILTMVLLTLVTLGLYVSVWFYTRREGFVRLDESAAKKTGGLINGVAASQIAMFVLSFLGESGDDSGFASLVSLVFVGILVYAAFHIRDLLRKHAARVAPQSLAFVAPSGLLTFFLTIYYLQVHINRMISARMLDLKA